MWHGGLRRELHGKLGGKPPSKSITPEPQAHLFGSFGLSTSTKTPEFL